MTGVGGGDGEKQDFSYLLLVAYVLSPWWMSEADNFPWEHFWSFIGGLFSGPFNCSVYSLCFFWLMVTVRLFYPQALGV